MWLFLPTEHNTQKTEVWYIQQEDHLWISFKSFPKSEQWTKKSVNVTVLIRDDSFQVVVKYDFFQAWTFSFTYRKW